MQEILDALRALGLGVLSLLGLCVAAATPFIISWIKVVGEAKVAEAKRAAAEAARAAQEALVRAGETATQAVEEEAHVTPMLGTQKLKLAEQTAAELLTVRGESELAADDPRVRAVVRAGVQRMRSSTPSASMPPVDATTARPPPRRLIEVDDPPTTMQRPRPTTGPLPPKGGRT